MNYLIYVLALALVRAIQLLPLTWVARLGRAGGALAYWVDARHRRVALENLNACFGREKNPIEIAAIARENFRRLGENYCSAIKTAAMSLDQLKPHLEFVGHGLLYPEGLQDPLPRRVVAIGHFGNFELYARFGHFMPGAVCATTYRAIQPAGLNKLLLRLRQESECLFFERRTESAALRTAMSKPGMILGLLIDQHASHGAVWVPLFGRDCATSTAPALFALRYRCKLFAGFCYRTGLAQWRIEATPEIPTWENDHPRALADITADINRTFEAAIRRDPANWFWVHRRWKAKPHEPQGRESKTAAPPASSSVPAVEVGPTK